MTDRHVDELLADLDLALAVEPSPSVAARVRTSVARDTGAGWLGRRWPAIAAAAAAAIIVAAIIRPWGDESPVPSPPPAASAELKPVVAPVAVPVATLAPRVAEPPTSVAHRAEAVPEPEVIVSPSQRLALDQLAAAVRDGRINSDSFPIEEEPMALDVVRITPIVLEMVKLDRPPGVVF